MPSGGRRRGQARPGALVVVFAVLGALTTLGGVWQLVVQRDWGMVVALPINLVLWWWLIGGAVRREQDRAQELRS